MGISDWFGISSLWGDSQFDPNDYNHIVPLFEEGNTTFVYVGTQAEPGDLTQYPDGSRHTLNGSIIAVPTETYNKAIEHRRTETRWGQDPVHLWSAEELSKESISEAKKQHASSEEGFDAVYREDSSKVSQPPVTSDNEKENQRLQEERQALEKDHRDMDKVFQRQDVAKAVVRAFELAQDGETVEGFAPPPEGFMNNPKALEVFTSLSGEKVEPNTSQGLHLGSPG